MTLKGTDADVSNRETEQTKNRVLVTGAAGYIGSAVCERLHEMNSEFTAAVRGMTQTADNEKNCYESVVSVGDIGTNTDWTNALKDVSIIIHTAGKAHDARSDDDAAEYDEVNVQGALALLKQAEAAGVKRFVHLSSAKVYGEFSQEGAAFKEEDSTNPGPVYAQSKCRAEGTVIDYCQNTSMEYVVVRLPLVYDQDAPANFKKLLQISALPLLLPFASVQNQRSMIYRQNLVSFLLLVLQHPGAANQVFNVSDDDDQSLPSLIKHLSSPLTMGARCFRFPTRWLKALGNKRYAQLVLSLSLDVTKAKHVLGWKPDISARDALKASMSGYQRKKT